MTTEAERTATLLAELEAWSGDRCSECGRATCHHELVVNTAMGFKSTPRCVECLARGVGQSRDAFLAQAHAHVLGRECFEAGWAWASRHESAADATWPACLFPGGPLTPRPTPHAPSAAPTDLAADDAWDAGGMTCGDLVLELRLRMRRLDAGQVLHVTATDSSAPEDLPAWCRMTGHRMVRFEHPHYWIQRKED